MREWEKPLSGTALSFLLFRILIRIFYFSVYSQPDGTPDFVTLVSAGQPVPWVHPSPLISYTSYQVLIEDLHDNLSS